MSELPDPLASGHTPDQQAMLDALNALLVPLARLVVSRGIHFDEVEERLKVAFVQAAREANPGGLPHRQVSRISTTTGINRREVTRLVHSDLKQATPRRSHAAELYAHWLTNPVYRAVDGQPLDLPRQGTRPSFESLARDITSDVHPRSLLAEMQRLGFVQLEEGTDTVQALRDALVPRDDLPRALRILGDNVGAHLAGTVANVLGDGRQHFDQAIVATGLSEASLQTLRKLIAAQWRRTFDDLVPALERLVEQDQQAAARDATDSANDGRQPAPAPRHRAVIGFYSHHLPLAIASTDLPADIAAGPDAAASLPVPESGEPVP
jgi:hypothetical protein